MAGLDDMRFVSLDNTYQESDTKELHFVTTSCSCCSYRIDINRKQELKALKLLREQIQAKLDWVNKLIEERGG